VVRPPHTGKCQALALTVLVSGCSVYGNIEAWVHAKTSADEPDSKAPASEEAGSSSPKSKGTKAKAKAKGEQPQPPGVLLFRSDDEKLPPGARSDAVLGDLKLFLERNPQVTRLRIEGHTNNTRPSEQSLLLSGQRAVSVRQWLVAHGISPRRLLAVGFGEARPVANNSDPTGVTQNERVQFRIAELDGEPRGDPLGGGTEFP
jgi:OmpA-OmpF porin, OOP family